jgi:hypothetical protein
VTGASADLDAGGGQHIRLTVLDPRPIARGRDAGVPDSGTTVCALAIGLENLGSVPFDESTSTFVVETARGDALVADLLLEVGALAEGDTAEGWVVFDLPDGETPQALCYAHPTGGEARWPLGPVDDAALG